MRNAVRRLLLLAAPLAVAAPVVAAVGGAAQPPAPAGGNPLALTYHTPDAAHGARLSATCQGCHGANGVSTNAEIPRLAGQVPDYLRFQLAAFRAKLRPSEIMQKVASGLKDQDIADLAAHFSAQAVGPAWATTDAALRARGEALFQRGDPARNAIACAICHGQNGRGEDRLGVASVTHQSPAYALDVLHEFKNAPSFGGIIYPEAMRIALRPLNDQDLRAVAAYVSSMNPGR